MGDSEQAIFKTLLYSSLFSFPLTEDELYYYLITDSSVNRRKFATSLKHISSSLSFSNGFIALKNQEQFIKRRLAREKDVEEKRSIAKKISTMISFLPTVYFVGISGGVGVGNANSNDDIDFFVITKTGTLYTTRFLLLCLLQLLGLRRGRAMKKVKNMICLNMLIDELGMKQSQRDLYTAHEIAQLYPLFDRQSTYKKFLKKNAWLGEFLSHAQKGRDASYLTKPRNKLEIIFLFTEPLAKYLQLVFINRHKTSEKIDNHTLAFHPKDYRQVILPTFLTTLKQHKKTIGSK